MTILETLSIIVPAYNEEKTISTVLKAIVDVELIENTKKEIIIVNDCSTDSTLDKAYEFKRLNPDVNISIYNHEVNQGKGAALHTGIKEAKGDYIIVQDADLEYDPNEINDLIRPILKGHADVVYGSRYKGNRPHRILFFWHSKGNKILTAFSNMCTNLNLSDMETCYKLIPTKLIQNFKLKEKRFGFEPEVTANISRNRDLRIYEVGISYYGRTFSDGKKINWKDGVRAIYCIMKYGLFKR